MSRKIRWILSLLLFLGCLAAFDAMAQSARPDRPAELVPFLDSDQRGMAIRPPRSPHFVVMNVRVFDAGNEAVFEYRSMGEVVAVDTLNWPNGHYRYEVSLVEDTRDRGITITERNSGSFRLEHGVIEMDPPKAAGNLATATSRDRT